MKPMLAGQFMTMLCAATTGWNDDSTEAYTLLVQTHLPDDAEIAIETALAVIGSWSQTSRPPWGVIQAAYSSTARRLDAERAMTRREVTRGAVIGPREGRKIAARAYVEECRLQGRPPTARMERAIAEGDLGDVLHSTDELR